MKSVRSAPHRHLGALLLGAAALLAACKSANSLGSGQTSGVGSNSNALYGGSSLQSPAGAQKRTDQPPTLVSVEEFSLRLERIFESRLPSGALLRLREVLYSDGLGKLRSEVLDVWDEATQTWIPPHPLLEALYPQRTNFIVRHRDLHLHARGLYANYRWEPLPGTVIVDGRICRTTRAHSLHGHGPIDLISEIGTDLLLGWKVWDKEGAQVLQSLTTTDIETNPNLNAVVWENDLLPEESYDSNVHDAQLGFTPRPLLFPPTGFYREKAVVEALSAHGSPVEHVYLEYWSDGLRTLFLMQHPPMGSGGTSGGMQVARLSAEGGIVVVESDAVDRRIVVTGMLPRNDVLMVVGALYE